MLPETGSFNFLKKKKTSFTESHFYVTLIEQELKIDHTIKGYFILQNLTINLEYVEFTQQIIYIQTEKDNQLDIQTFS